MCYRTEMRTEPPFLRAESESRTASTNCRGRQGRAAKKRYVLLKNCRARRTCRNGRRPRGAAGDGRVRWDRLAQPYKYEYHDSSDDVNARINEWPIATDVLNPAVDPRGCPAPKLCNPSESADRTGSFPRFCPGTSGRCTHTGAWKNATILAAPGQHQVNPQYERDPL